MNLTTPNEADVSVNPLISADILKTPTGTNETKSINLYVSATLKAFSHSTGVTLTARFFSLLMYGSATLAKIS